MNSMINNNSDTVGSGMFTPFTFQQGTWYDVKLDFTTQLDQGTIVPDNLQAYGYVKFFAASTLAEHTYDACYDRYPNATSAHISTQMIGSYLGITVPSSGINHQTYSFQAGSTYSQFWIFPYPGKWQIDYALNLYGIAICPSCTATANYPTGTLPTLVAGGTVTIGGGTAGSSIAPAASTTISASQVITFEPGFSALASGGTSLFASIVPCGTGSTITTTDAFDSLTVITPPVFVDSSSTRNAAQAGQAAKLNSADSSLSKLLIYPTVSTGVVTVTGSSASLGNADMLVVDESGRTVYHLHNGENTTVSLYLGHLANGLYFLRINNGTGPVTVQKLIINK